MNYDKYPETKIIGFDDDVFENQQQIKEKIMTYKSYEDFCLTVACLSLIHILEEGNVRITKQQVLPMMGSAVDEAIIMNCDQKQL